MVKTLGWLCWLGMVSLSAGEIVAWKVPLSRYSSDPNERNLLEKPPEASPFFQPGDKLWNVGTAGNRSHLEWAVWNETSATLVTKSGMESVPALHQFLGVDQLPLHGRVKLEILETRAGESAGPDTPPVYSLEATGKPESGFTADSETEGKRIQMKAELEFDESGKDNLLKLEATFQLPEQAPLKVETNLALESGSSFKFAEDSSGGKGMAVRVTADAVTMDGTPLRDQIRIQKDGVPAPLDLSRKTFRKHRISENQWLGVGPFPLSNLDHLAPGVRTDYALPENQLPKVDYPEGPVVRQNEGGSGDDKQLTIAKVPDLISGWFGGTVLDLRKVLQSNGVSEEQDFAGYDVRGNAIVLLTSSELEIDKLEQLLSSMGFWPRGMISVSCEHEGASNVITRPGMRAALARGTDEANPSRSLEVEPVFGHEGFVAMRFYFSDRPSKRSAAEINTSLELEKERAVEVHVDGMKKPLRVRADILER